MRSIFLSLILIPSLSWAMTIVIDPGHGGEDHGAKGFKRVGKKKVGISEKELTLAIAKKIKKRLDKKYNAYLTRSIDKTLSLEKRADIAEKLKADLFISIHINANQHTHSHGFETYYLDNHGDAAVKKIESVENKNVDGTQAVINQILADLVIDRLAPKSKILSNMIHKNISKGIKRKYKMRDRGIKPGLFYVLALSKRPAVLLEAGFISNPREIKKITTKSFQNSYAKSVADAIDKYIRKYHSKSVSLF